MSTLCAQKPRVMAGTVKLEDRQRLAQEEESEAKRLAIMMMKKREKYLYNKIMFGKRRKIREVSLLPVQFSRCGHAVVSRPACSRADTRPSPGFFSEVAHLAQPSLWASPSGPCGHLCQSPSCTMWFLSC